MVLHVDSDVAEARSFYAGHFYLSDWPSPSPIKPNPDINGPIHTKCKTIRNVVSSAAEAKTFFTFNNGKTAIGMRPALIALEHELTSNTPQNGKFYIRRICKLCHETKTFKKIGY